MFYRTATCTYARSRALLSSGGVVALLLFWDIPARAHGPEIGCEELSDQRGNGAFLSVGSYTGPTIPGFVRGCGFEPAEEVAIEVRLLQDGNPRVVNAKVKADFEGNFHVELFDAAFESITDPDSIRGYTLTAQGGWGSSATYSRGDRPSVTIDPRGEMEGETPSASCSAYHLIGYGFQPGEQVRLEAATELPSGETVPLDAVQVQAGSGMDQPPEFDPQGYFVTNLVHKGKGADLIGGTIKVTAIGDKGSRSVTTQEALSCVDLDVATPEDPGVQIDYEYLPMPKESAWIGLDPDAESQLEANEAGGWSGLLVLIAPMLVVALPVVTLLTMLGFITLRGVFRWLRSS